MLKRIKEPEVLPGVMDISTAIIAPNASLIATEFSPFGSLLDINNKIRQATTKVMHESLVMHFSAQICNIVDHLHRQHIIHADIKPDNFLLMRVPNVDSPLPSLRLIDFGCAIDMTLFPDGEKTKFRKVVQTDGFTCIEMQEGRSWSYETDLFCIAATVHVMLFGDYMQPQRRAPAGKYDKSCRVTSKSMCGPSSSGICSTCRRTNCQRCMRCVSSSRRRRTAWTPSCRSRYAPYPTSCIDDNQSIPIPFC